MTADVRPALWLLAAAAAVSLWSATPAEAITADLAKKCREMANKAHPVPRTGNTADAARANLQYYRLCVARDGKMD